jgi:ABC-type amino acid transport substrate-binding protein
MNHEKLLKIFLILTAIAGVWHFTKKQVRADNENVFVVGISAENPPFAFMESDYMVGFDIDVIKEVAQRMGKNLQIRNMPLNTLVSEVLTHNIHAIATKMPPSEKLMSHVFFTEPYYKSNISPRDATLTTAQALAISKKYPALYEHVQQILYEMKEDGTLDDIQQKWELHS